MIKKILKYTNEEDRKILLQTSQPVETITPEIKQLIQDMKDTLVAQGGVGLAAIQLGYPYQICVINWVGLHVLINPQIIRTRGTHKLTEGCLSLPGIFVENTRFQKVWISALNEDGQEYEYAEGGNGSFIAQHEIEHFQGKCIVFETYDNNQKKEENKNEK